MKKLFFSLSATVLVVVLVYGAIIMRYRSIINQSLVQNTGEYVVLLHGLGRTSFSMQKIGIELAHQGYRVINIGYPSRSYRIQQLSDDYLEKELQERYTDKSAAINFVTHSMGGIIVREYLVHHTLEHLNRVVMLAPPNRGSALADKRSESKLMTMLLGPSLAELTTASTSFVNSLPEPDYALGIIAGEYDEKVSIDNTRLGDAENMLIVPYEHTFIMRKKDVINAISNFLTQGTF